MSAALWPRRLPPYGKQLLTARQLGQRPADGVFVTDAWAPARYLREVMDLYVIVAPRPDLWEFGFLRGLDVVLIHDNPDALGLAMQIADARPASFGSLTFREWLDVSSLLINGRSSRDLDAYWAAQLGVPVESVRNVHAALGTASAVAA